MKKNEIYQAITERIIKKLEAGTAPWMQPWKSGLPMNYVSKKPYRGINMLLLFDAEYESNYWLTFKQINDLKGYVKKGGKGSWVIFYQPIKVETGKKDENGNPKHKTVPMLRHYIVWNIEQTTLTPRQEAKKKFNAIEECEAIVQNMPTKPQITHDQTRACYIPSLDVVKMPQKSFFESESLYYSVLFHELSHASGHGTRLNREGIISPEYFGSEVYSREELTAELSACFLCGHAGIENNTISLSASYLQSWIKALKGDSRLIFKAATQAQKACDYILGQYKPENAIEQ